MNNPYWERVSKIAQAQRDKGLLKYGYGLEDNPTPTINRLQYIEEELIDALMYIEWLKEGLQDGSNIR